MNLQTIRDNLKNTISGKEKMLKQYEGMLDTISKEPAVVGMTQINNDLKISYHATIGFLGINIDELKRILADVEQCSPTWNVHNCPYTETCHRID